VETVSYETGNKKAKETKKTRRHLVRLTPPPRHTEIGTVSLPTRSRYTGLSFSALRRNRSCQLRFHFSHQSATGLSVNMMKCLEYHSDRFQNSIFSSLVHNRLFLKIMSWKFIHNLLNYSTKTDRQLRVKNVTSTNTWRRRQIQPQLFKVKCRICGMQCLIRAGKVIITIIKTTSAGDGDGDGGRGWLGVVDARLV